LGDRPCRLYEETCEPTGGVQEENMDDLVDAVEHVAEEIREEEDGNRRGQAQ